MNGKTLSIWSRMGARMSSGESHIWSSMSRNYHWMLGFMQWVLGDGRQEEVGLDALKGFIGNHSLSYALLKTLHDKGIFNYAHITDKNNWFTSQLSWLRAIYIGLIDNLAIEWEAFLTNLYDSGAYNSVGEDIMQWEGPKKMDIQNSMIYIIMFHWQKKHLNSTHGSRPHGGGRYQRNFFVLGGWPYTIE